MTALTCLKMMSGIAGKFDSRERVGKVSNAELQRWLERNSVYINGRTRKPMEEVDFPITSFVLFPWNEHSRVTMVMDDETWNRDFVNRKEA